MRAKNLQHFGYWTLCFATNLLFAAQVANAQSTVPQREDVEANDVLDRFLGQWQTHTEIHHAGPPTRDFNTRGNGHCRRTLDGRFVEFRTESIPPGDSDLQIMTFDSKAGVYHQWVFSSDGYTHEATGRWDPAKSTLRWAGNTAAGSFVILDHWLSPNRLEWTLERIDGMGKVVQLIRGILERAK